jgi:hypothetical protein
VFGAGRTYLYTEPKIDTLGEDVQVLLRAAVLLAPSFATSGAQRDRRLAGGSVNWTVVFSLVLLGAIYFPTALWLKGNHVPPRFGPAPVSDARLILKLEQPFEPYGGHAFWARAPGLESMADSAEAPRRSPVLLYENDTLLGPAHTEHAEISEMGGGRYSHWDIGVVFSSKNGEQPGPRGKTYWLVVPQWTAPPAWGSDPRPWPSGQPR